MTPDVEELPFKVTDVAVHVSVPLTLAVAPGAVLFCVTVTIAVDLHPFVGLVTVSVSLPVELTVGFCEVDFKPFDPDQL